MLEMSKNNPLVKVSVYLIRNLHQKRISPYRNKKGYKCRFHHSCSNYGILALKQYGFFKGWVKTVGRIFRCNPNNFDSCVDYP